MLAIKARYDGRKVILPKEKRFPIGSVIIVFDMPAETDAERFDWQKLSVQNLASAYGANEPDYSKKLVKESNEEYKPLKKARSS